MERTEQYIDSLLNTIRTSLPNFAKQTLSDALKDQAADAQATIAALQARVKELEEWQQIVAGTQDRQDLIYRLSDHLTQRTAELEAANDKVQFLEKKNSNLLDSSNTVLKVKADQDVRLADLQAELERVRADNKALDEWRADVTVSLQRPGGAFFVDVPQHIKDLVKERDDLRALILALPKVEGEITANRVCTIMMRGLYCEEFTKLLQHRQGMEGCP